ncbi:Slam-dependent surface lipoprotein [Moraxella oblonga]|uniref:Slam-dependent surface lipoprotein n=1 Tax=Moraxella oblonga TaxID=200413 RepID=UPI0008338776|nr:Slam-dependent surface lipoprotein [Moraxella oblonga]
MKTPALSLAIAISSALALTACGGGGSSGGSTAQPSTPVVKPNPTNPTNPAKVQISGESLVVNTKADTDGKFINTNTDNINTLNVDGKTFNIGSPNIIFGSFGDINNAQLHTTISGTHMKYAKYGFVRDKNAQMEYYFYQGEKTPVANVPTTGTANYKGQSIYACETCNSQMVQGTSEFKVDFGKKTLSGSISNAKVSNIALNATISGNSFNGKNSAGTETRGAFFGDKAQEISGAYVNNEKAFGGVFGATKQ